MDKRQGWLTGGSKALFAKMLRGVGLDQSVKAVLTSVQERSGLFGPRSVVPWPDVDQQIEGVVRRSPEMSGLLDSAHNGNVLFAVPRGIYYDLVLQAGIAYRLLYEGWSSSFLVCQRLPRCNNRDIQTGKASNLLAAVVSHETVGFFEFRGCLFTLLTNLWR